MSQAGYYLGRHYSQYGPDILFLARHGFVVELEALLWHLIDAVEAECFLLQQLTPITFYDLLLEVLVTRRAPVREELSLLLRFCWQRILPQDRSWAESELERVRGRLVA